MCAVHACKYALAPCAPTKQDKTVELQRTASGIIGFGGAESKQNETIPAVLSGRDEFGTHLQY